MRIDVDHARLDTPGCEFVTHFNNAGSSLPPAVVTETVIGHLRREEETGGYEAATEAAERMDRVYDSAAGLIGADRSEIALMGSATMGWNIAFLGLQLGAGDRVLLDRARYASHALTVAALAERTGATIELVEDDPTGQLDLSDLERKLGGSTKLVALTHIPTDRGLINPIAAAGALCRDAGVPLLLDACQSVGQLAVDVDELGCDMLTATGRKFFRGPRGTGFLYVRGALQDRIRPTALDTVSATWTSPETFALQPGAVRYETFERSVALTLGLGAAIDYAAGWGLRDIEERIRSLGASLRERLSTVSGVTVDHRGPDQCGIVTFLVDGVDSVAVSNALRERRINTSVTRSMPSATDEPARVRASVHYYNTEDEIDALVAVVTECAGG